MASQINALQTGLREFGYEDGRNIRLDFRGAEGVSERLPALAAELTAAKVDVIASFGTPSSLAAKRATSTIPIVMVAVGDPVGSGLVASLARPGRNITGMSLVSPQVVAKRMELLKEAQPQLRRIAVLVNPSNPAQKISIEAAHAAASALKVELTTFEARTLDEIVAAFSAMAAQGAEAVVLANDILFTSNGTAIAALAMERRLPERGLQRARSGGSSDWSWVLYGHLSSVCVLH